MSRLFLAQVRRDALFCLMRVNSVIESHDANGSDSDVDGGVACCSGGVARRGAASEVPLLENVERSAVAAVLWGGFSLPLPRLLHRAARRGFSLVVGERERGSAGARGRCPSRRPTLSKPTRSSTHTRRFYTSSRHDGGDKRFMLARVHARRTRTHATHTRTNNASPRRRTHAARRRRGRRRRARSQRISTPRDGSRWWTQWWCGQRDGNRYRPREISIRDTLDPSRTGAAHARSRRANPPRVRASAKEEREERKKREKERNRKRLVPVKGSKSRRPTRPHVYVPVYVRVYVCGACVTYDNLPPGFGAPPECDVRTPTRPNPPLHFFHGGHGVPRVNSEGRPSRRWCTRWSKKERFNHCGGEEETAAAPKRSRLARTFLELSAADIGPWHAITVPRCSNETDH